MSISNYYLYCYPDHVDSAMIDYDTTNSQIIYLGSPFLGYPSLTTDCKDNLLINKILILDLNIVSHIRKKKPNKNLAALLAWAVHKNVEVNPTISIAELFRSHNNPKHALNEYIEVLNKNYNYDIPVNALKDLSDTYTQVNLRKNVEMITDFLVTIKYIYNKKLSLNDKIISLSNIIKENNLPIFGFAYLFACTSFLVKHNPSLFDIETVNKVNKDMTFSSTIDKERKKLSNTASDLILFISSIEHFHVLGEENVNFVYIASSDVTTKLLLSELCYGMITLNKELKFSDGHA